MLLNHAFVRLCGVFNSILKDVPLRRQKLLDLVKARPAFTAGAIDQLADLKPVAAHGGLPWHRFLAICPSTREVMRKSTKWMEQTLLDNYASFVRYT